MIFILEKAKRRSEDKANTRLARREKALFQAKRGSVCLLIGTGGAQIGGIGDKPSPEDRRRALEWSAEEFIKPGEDQEEGQEIELLRKVLVEGALCARSGEGSLKDATERLGKPWSESLELFEQAIGMAETKYRESLGDSFDKRIERLQASEAR